MLKRFFTPKWQHQDASVRELALEDLDTSNDAEIIIKMASDDPSNKIREIALNKVSDISVLQSLLSCADNPVDWCRFAFKLNQLLPQVDSLTSEFEKAKEQWDKDEVFSAIASNTSNQELTNSLLLAINDPDVLFKIATTAKSIELRLKAVEDIKDLEQLSLLSKKATHKQVLQVVRAKLADAKSQQKVINETINGAEHLAVTLQKLSQQSWFDAQLETKVNHAVESWRKLDLEKVESATKSQKNALMICVSDFQNHLKKCQDLIAENKVEIEQAAAKQDALEKQNALCTQLENLVKEMYDPAMNEIESYQSVKEALDFLNSNWQQTIKESQPDKKVSNSYQELQKQLQMTLMPWEKFIGLKVDIETFFSNPPDNSYESLGTWLKRWNQFKTKLAWVEGVSMPLLLNDWCESAEIFQTQYEKIVTEQKKKAKYLNQRIMILEKHCQQRNLIAANKLANYINQKLNDSISDFRASLAKKIESIQPQLDELRDWHAFATGPKKDSLCESMEQLIDESLEPLARAKKVRELQHQWRELLASDPNADDQLWERFKKASDTAYLPCLDFYAEKDKARAENLNKRIAICDSLEKIVVLNGWSGEVKEDEEASLPPVDKRPDWKDVDKQVSKATREWKNHQPVPDNERESIQKQFNSILNIIKKQLENEKQTNLDERCELVKKAVEFYESDDTEKSIQGVLRLQKQWKELGLTFYKADREQWLLFREAIDKVFAKRDSQKKEFKNELKSNQVELKNITKEIGVLCELDDKDLKQSYSKFEELKNSWTHDKELPKATAQSILNSFNSSCSRYQEHYAGLTTRQKQTAFEALLAGAKLMQAVEEKLLESQLSNVAESELEQLKTALSQLDCDDKGKRIIDSRFNRITSSIPARENHAGLERLLTMALNTEILLSIDSPESLKEQRVAIQLEQLQKGFGTTRADIDNKKEVLKMYESWLSIGFIKKTDRTQLEDRRVKIFKAVGL